MIDTSISEKISRFVMLDFEASGLERGSWPIEVGLSRVDADGSIVTWSSLIRPHADWSLDYWSEQSAGIHGISLEELRTAPAAEDIARETSFRCDGMAVLSDAPEFEQRWLDRLLDTIGEAGNIVVRDFDMLTVGLFDGRRLNRVYEHLARHPGPHRAGPDSRRLVAAWVAAAKM